MAAQGSPAATNPVQYPAAAPEAQTTHTCPQGLQTQPRTVTKLPFPEQNLIRSEARTEKTKNILIAATVNLIAGAILMHFVAAGALTLFGVIIVEVIAAVFIWQKLGVLEQKIDIKCAELLHPPQEEHTLLQERV